MENLLTNKFEADREAIRAQIVKAVAAIAKYADKKEAERNEATQSMDLLPEPEAFTIAFSLTKIPVKKEYRFHTIELPHAIMNKESQTFCLLVRDPKENAVTQVKANELPIEKVIAVKSLKRKYASRESRKELANRFDLFFCESQIYEMMGKLLGSYFFENKKAKIPMALKDLSRSTFDKAMRTTRFRIRGGTNIGIRIGNRSMSTESLVDNAVAVVDYIATKFCPKFANNVHNISVSATNVIELPIWSVPIGEMVEETTAAEPAVVVDTPKKRKVAEKSAEEVPLDIATAPVKMLKKVQAAKVEKVQEQLQPASKKSAPKRTSRK
jgi:ribosomal protein L1